MYDPYLPTEHVHVSAEPHAQFEETKSSFLPLEGYGGQAGGYGGQAVKGNGTKHKKALITV